MGIEVKNSCKFCGSIQLRFFEAQERMIGLGDSFEYTACQDCGSLQISEIPENLSTYYSHSNYYSFLPLVRSGRLKNLLKTLRIRTFLQSGLQPFSPEYGYWLKKVHSSFDAKIADVGCGNGQLLYELAVSGYSDLHGIDPFIEDDVRLHPHVRLYKKELQEVAFQFELIMMHHSFEHMGDPKETLEVCRERLSKGGRLLIRTPVSDASVWKDHQEFWVQLDAPRHLVIPSVAGMKSLAGQFGFQIDEIEFDSTAFQFWGTELYEKGLTLSSKPEDHFTKEELAEMQKKALRYNREGKGDQVCFYMTKIA
ncbi:class I SAM-dependent methyltransferase [Algoriphagus halophytocola]|uniref:Class I SAM-dependent methyltransferase n=1 Tax=Algoriphagus halophytocola TaxID=2991499 RepID=A0ABY6MH37_9BACT|nr:MULTISPECIES: class I SAM-dependent methyltransferase [unclassified Algoriphagus]UZD21727.1 class I SAM-dependent methyltransferase [Algoriphagus sp. TR-M5]WBL42939.1 class I SAM-dependent methyltransferase [Algoriphagus sp. TR-M9]